MDKANLDASIRHLVENTAEHANRERLQVLDKHTCVRAMFEKMAASYSVIITLSAVDEAPLELDDMGSPVFNTLWTASRFVIRTRLSYLTQSRVFMCP
jgi:hypothetical protein